jgi:signal peptidase I
MEAKSPRRALAAVLLSMVAPGLGHLYCGRAARGLVLVVLSVSLGPLGMFGFLPVSSRFATPALAAFAAFALLWVWATVDAARTARKIGADYELKDFNRWYVYLVLALLAVPAAAGWASFIRHSLLEAFRVPTRSMAPSIRPGDVVLADKTAFREGPVRRGDVVIFPNPNQRHQAHIKRVVALPGDTVAMANGRLLLNGKALDLEPAGTSDAGGDPELAGEVAWEVNGEAKYRILLAPPGTAGPGRPDFPETRVPNGMCFALGDNRGRSEDSRAYGFVPLADLVGRVDRVIYPRWERLK